MELSIIWSTRQYRQYRNWVEQQFDRKVRPGTPAGEKLDLALLLIRHYENRHFPIPVTDPIQAIRLRMTELGMKNKDLVGKVGSKGYVSLLLNRKKSLTLEMAKLFHRDLKIPAEILLS